MQEIQVTFKGATINEIAVQAKAFVMAATAPVTSVAKGAPGDVVKKAAPKPVEIEDDEVPADDEDVLADDSAEDGSFDDIEDDEEIEAPPKKAAAKTKEVTEQAVQLAAMAHAKKNGRKATVTILEKKFKVKSVAELKTQQQRSAALAALAI